MKKIQAIRELPEEKVNQLEDYIFYAIDVLLGNVKYLKIQKESAKFNESDAVEVRVQNFTGESYRLRELANLMDVIFGFDREDPMCSFPEGAAIQENMIFRKDLATKPAKYFYE